MTHPRMDTETRCAVCKAYRYHDVNEGGEWVEDGNWHCAIHSGNAWLAARTEALLRWHDEGQLIHKTEYAKLLREWVNK